MVGLLGGGSRQGRAAGRRPDRATGEEAVEGSGDWGEGVADRATREEAVMGSVGVSDMERREKK